MRKQNETRYIVTDIASIPVIRLAGKTEAYKLATKPGWGTVEWYSAADGYKNPVYRDRSDKTQELACDEDSNASLYTKNGGYFGIFPYDEIDVKKMPKQADTAAIIHSDSCGFSFWAQDGAIRIFVTYDENGLIDTYRLEYGENEQPYDGETELSFDDLYEPEADDYEERYRANIPGTWEYNSKQETAQAEQDIAEAAAGTAGEDTKGDAGADTNAAKNSQQAPAWAQEINAGNLYAKTSQKTGGGGAGPPPPGKRETGVKSCAAV